MDTTIGSLVYVLGDRSQKRPGPQWTQSLRTPSMVGVGNFSFLSCVVAQPVDWLLRAVGFLMMQPEFSMALGNTVLVMGLNFRGLQTNDKRGKFSFRVKLNFRGGESSI